MQQTEQAPSVVNIVQNEEISPGNNGIHTDNTLDQPISYSQISDGTQFAVNTLIEISGTFSEPICTPPMSVLQPVDSVEHAVNSEPYEMEFQHVNATTVHIQKTHISVSKQAQLVNKSPSKELPASSNILTEDGIMLRNVISQSNDNLGDGIEIAMKYAYGICKCI